MAFKVNKSILAGLALASSISSMTSAAPYEVVDLGTLGGIQNFAFALNNLNEVTGVSDGPEIPSDQITDENPGDTCILSYNQVFIRDFCLHAYLYSAEALIDLGALNANRSYGLGINDQSTVVGYALEEIDDGDPDTVNPITDRAVVSYLGEQVSGLPYPDESANLKDDASPEMRALGINNNNEVVGYALIRLYNTDQSDSINAFRPFIYNLDTMAMRMLPIFEDNYALGGVGRAINDQGQVVGWGGQARDTSGYDVVALVWDPNDPEFSKALGTLGGRNSEAYDINDNGLVVGVADTDENFFRNQELAFVYDLNTDTMIQLPEFSTIDEFKQSQAYSINNANQIVGTAQSAASYSNVSSAFLYTVGDEELVNLNDMIDCDAGWNLVSARAINEAGYIVGTGTLGGEVKSFMLVPTADTTPTNCTKGDRADPDQPDQGGDGSGSTTGWLLFLLSGVAIIRRYARSY